MRALTKRSATPHDVVVQDLPKPEPSPGQVRVRTEACGLCGSDVHAWRHDTGYEWIRPPVVLGHEAVGYVEALGEGVDPSWLGKRVVPVAIDGCGVCDLCERGLRQICPERTVLGLSFDGAAAESFVVPEVRLVEVDRHLPASTLALTEPLSVACRAVAHIENAAVGPTRVVVSGPGPIGTMAALVLAQRGHDVVLSGVDNDDNVRLPLARALGLRTVIAGRDELPFTPTAWVDASGSTAALDAAIAAVLPGSPISVVGLFARTGPVDFNAVTRKEIRLQGSYGSTKVDYQAAADAMAADQAPWPRLVTEIPLTDAASALERAAAGHDMKVVLVP
ncbi:alcohol dehydrogenase catalytic domain-containing protein [Rhodococcus sp. MSC1_016]|jgi:L-iditol 2-dehydrogenase|uniref:alcohol dehydrogenase catalytic domain-containing protein n=1 Tax=Rhodococcus sp. MSC1_016 TaxID=2909266 RepID=UPI00202E5941|nr:alcohol dehydrogenase catalytic domain-containing protein [Rhodococcus sp. MSC1_016]